MDKNADEKIEKDEAGKNGYAGKKNYDSDGLSNDIAREGEADGATEMLLPNYHEKMVIKSTAYAIYSIRFW